MLVSVALFKKKINKIKKGRRGKISGLCVVFFFLGKEHKIG